MKIVVKIAAIALMIIISAQIFAQKKLAEFPFETSTTPLNVNTAIGMSKIQLMIASPDVLLQSPSVILDGNVNAMFYQFNANYSVVANNLNFAIAPKQGNNVRITHIEFRVRFGSVNVGNAGIFISKDPTYAVSTQLWTCGNNKTFISYRDFVVPIPESSLSYSDSPTDSIRFVFGHGANTLGMYIDNFEIYGIVNNEANTQSISINAGSISKELAVHPSGANSCWLMDSDTKWPRTVSNESRFAEMKLGALRFPYGHLADNYLWHTPGQYSNIARTGLIPQVASSSMPATWTWAVSPTNGTFLKDLSFDEYMGMCKRNGIEPLIVINAQSHKYTGGPTYNTLKTSAVEWVRYANITQKYGIKYWQIGNEVEHDDKLTMSEYTTLFVDFATAMKAIDPTIKVGTGVLSTTSWNKDVLSKAGTLCSFISTHNYQFSSSVAAGGFRAWYKDNSILVSNTDATQKMLDANFSSRPNIEIHVTETNVTGGDFPDMDIIDIYKALYWFEMDMNQLALKNVKYTYCWGTHSPWGGEFSLGDIGSLLENSNANTIRPAGRVIQLINTFLKNKLVSTTRVSGTLRKYASVSTDGNELSVFLLNKDLYAETANLNITNFSVADADVEQITFAGTNFNDTNPVITTTQLTSPPSQITLAPVSLTILNYKRKTSGLTDYPSEKKNVKFIFDGENIKFLMPATQKGKMILYRLDGRKIMDYNFDAGTETINLSKLSAGIYIANMQIENTNASSIKIVK